MVSCLHQFCYDCLFTWLVIKESCPVCKASVECIIRNKILPCSSDSADSNDADSNVQILRLKGDVAVIPEDADADGGRGGEDDDDDGVAGNHHHHRKRKVSREMGEGGEPARVDYNSLNQQLTRAISFHRSRKRLEVEQQREQAQSVPPTPSTAAVDPGPSSEADNRSQAAECSPLLGGP